MAFQMSFTTPFGITCTESYWRPALVDVNKHEKAARVLFYGYSSSDAAAAYAEPVGRKEYAVFGDEFTTYFGVDALNPEGKNPYAAAYNVAVARPEQSTQKSFFDGALNV